MTRAASLLAFLALAAALAAAAAVAQTSGPPGPVYKPPPRGAPGGRVGGGTRGTGVHAAISVLAPDHVGLTVREQPSLYWYVSRETSAPVEVTLIDGDGTRPLLEHRLAPPVPPGIHRLQLADHGIRLAPGVRYEWSVAVVTDPGRRSRDVVASGTIERITMPDDVRRRLAGVPPAAQAGVYAGAGIWYDALAALSEALEAAPDDGVLRGQRAALLEQVGLPEAAAFDRRRAPRPG